MRLSSLITQIPKTPLHMLKKRVVVLNNENYTRATKWPEVIIQII